ncbi:phosphate acetyltransferase [Mangrovimonas sp. AS39]|uniref:phosphate acetyltransferase n=1 Tax=Mangrovimonas TaxID=1211036 RepID=UPI0006B58690|nr:MULTISPECIES: phosphate acetyltransferase [Mangrovimonas]MCF1191385.1 phosphate acetyltransferase [Mangrovimonas futianensis]MCF1195080.1 phosphate acetyltransferase [Mangrovimonas futianensis]MCF1421242.1 phosphate acetyltransferase [Mangrovimonas futianensis]
MNKGLYVATMESHSGKSLITLGLMNSLLGKVARVAYFRPIIDTHKTGVDNHLDTVLSNFDLKLDYEQAYAYTRPQLVQMLNQGKSGQVLDLIIHKYKQLENDFDFVLVEGSDFLVDGTVFEFDFNVLMAKNLRIPAIIIGSGQDKSQAEMLNGLEMAFQSFSQKEVPVLGVIANKVSQDNLKPTKKELQAFFGSDVAVYAIPEIPTLANPTIKEVIDELEGTVLFGEGYLNNQTGSYAVGAMQLRNYLTFLREDALVITPGDRADIILGALQANISASYPRVSGIVLTGGLIPEEPILKLIEGLSQIVPIISVKGGTFSVTNKIGQIKSRIYASSSQKIETCLNAFEKYVPIDPMVEKLINFKPIGMTPRMFQYGLLQRAQKTKKHIVLPEGNDVRILQAAARLSGLNLVDLTLLGEKDKIEELVMLHGIPLDLNTVSIINPVESDYFEDYVSTFYELRKHKNVNMDIARDWMSDVSYFGTMMIYKGHADGMVSGAAHTTQHTIRPALQFIKTKPGVSVVSSIFFMCLEDRVSIFGDCAINPNPTAAELAEIAITSAESSKTFGIEPKIAMLSYSSGTSGKGEDVDRVREATEIVKKQRPDLKIEGPIQYDAAVDMAVGKSKMPDSEVAGQANVLIFPDLNTGNNTYKAVQRETGALAIGPMLQGLNKPVNDLSRGCTVDDVYNTIIITAIQAQL